MPGREVPVADALSRAPPKLVSEGTSNAQATESGTAMFALECNCMTSHLSISEPTLAELKKETARDAVLQELVAIVQKGWPERFSCVPIAVRPYYHLRSELVVEQRLVFKGHRSSCVVPSVMRPEILKKKSISHTWALRALSALVGTWCFGLG